MPKTLLSIMRNPENALVFGRVLQDHGYHSLTMSSAAEFQETLANPEQPIDLALFDITGYDATIWDWTEQLRTRHIPFFLISPKESAHLQQESLKHGSAAVLTKPLVIRELIGFIRSILNE